MPLCYSEDLRKAVVKAYLTNKWTQQEVADTFSIHLTTFKNIWNQYKDTGECAVDRENLGRKPAVDELGYVIIKDFVIDNPDATLNEMIEFYKQQRNTKLSLSMMHRALSKLNLNRKKKSLFAAEQERDDVKKKSCPLENNGRSGTRKSSIY